MNRYGDFIPDHQAEIHRKKAEAFHQACGDLCVSEEVQTEPIRARERHVIHAPLPDDVPLELRIHRWNRLFRDRVA